MNNGKKEYEKSLKSSPFYQDGTKRKEWHQLGELEQWSWGRHILILKDNN